MIVFLDRTWTELLTCTALDTYLKVMALSSQFISAGDIVAINNVLADPPRESFKSRVKILSRYGMNAALDASAVKQLVSANKLLLTVPVLL